MYSTEVRKHTEQEWGRTVRQKAAQTSYLPENEADDGKVSDLSFADMRIHYRSDRLGPEKTEPEERHSLHADMLSEAEEGSKEEIPAVFVKEQEEEAAKDTGGVIQRMPGILSMAAGLGALAVGYLTYRGVRYLLSPYRKSKRLVRGVEGGKIPLNTTRRKGNYGEAKMDLHFENHGYKRISRDRVTGIDDKIHHGLDGVYHKKRANPSFVVAEAKYNTARLGNTRDGQQMSHTWIRGSNRLVNAVGKKKADEIMMQGYDRQVFRVMPDHSTTCTRLQ